VVLLLLTLYLSQRKNNMETQNVFLGATDDVVATYDNSGVVQPGSSTAPVDTSVSTDTTTTTTTTDNTSSSNNAWILYLGVGIMAYALLFKKK
jgi:hypothetical protein